MNLCPCCSGKVFEDCCQPLMDVQSAPTALALMRSRYVAYSQGNAQYLVDTTHAKTRASHSHAAIDQWARENKWNRLELISTEHGNRNDDRGTVEFKAHFTDANGRAQIHHERSTFLKEAGKWYYLAGKFNPPPLSLSGKTSRNDPCPCGSGKKYKKCCGQAA